MLLPEHPEENHFPPPPPIFPIHILAELIGARHLPLDDAAKKGVEPYCIVQFGPKTLHTTKPILNKSTTSNQDPIFSIKEQNLIIVSLSASDLSNNKNLKIALWGRQSPGTLPTKQRALGLFLGKVRLKAKRMVRRFQKWLAVLKGFQGVIWGF